MNELGRIYDALVSEERSSSRVSIKSSPTRSEYNQGHVNGNQQNGHGANGSLNGHNPANGQAQKTKETACTEPDAAAMLAQPIASQQHALSHPAVVKGAVHTKHYHANPSAHASFIKSGRNALNALKFVSA